MPIAEDQTDETNFAGVRLYTVTRCGCPNFPFCMPFSNKFSRRSYVIAL